MARSSAYVILKETGTAYHFTGVTEIVHHLALKIFDKADVTEVASFVNGAKNEPDRVTLSVIETDAAHSADGWSARMMDILYSVKRNRMLCRVVTPQKSYEDMLLSDISATHNAENPDGWSGELTFTEYIPMAVLGEEKSCRSHAMRHCYASVLLENNVPMELISETMGHASVATTKIYAARFSVNAPAMAVANVFNK